MTFATGNTNADTYIDYIADQLIASTVWTAVDAAFFPAGATPAHRVVTDGVLFMNIERIVTNGNSNGAGASAINGSGQTRFNEIKIQFSTTYNTGTHLSTGTIQVCGIPLESWQKQNSGQAFFLNNDVGSGNKGIQHFTWSDPNGSILGVLVTTGAATTFDYITFYCIERNTAKLYADGFSSIFFTCFPAYDITQQGGSINGNANYFDLLPYDRDATVLNFNGSNGSAFGNYGGGGSLARPIYFHPFNGLPTFNELSYLGASFSGSTGTYFYPLWNKSVNTMMAGIYPGFELFRPATRSQGDSKVYFQFPVYSANKDQFRRNPVAQTPFWFIIGEASFGVADSDIIQYTPPMAALQDFLVKRLANQEATGGGFLSVAIRHA